MNSIMGMLGNNNIMMQAFGAMMRGETPQQFLQNLARSNPALQGVDLNNLQQTAQQLCNEKGVDMNAKIEEIKSQFPH
ncbi:MAG: hypothetical protein IKT30_06945 [Bacteroidaceae bacterium]|nr:hypothetical protein [Bacteroidaceae bacterium]